MSTVCKKCGTSQPLKKFCCECGERLQDPNSAPPENISTCGRCQSQFKPGARFCLQCGTSANRTGSLPPSPSPHREDPSTKFRPIRQGQGPVIPALEVTSGTDDQKVKAALKYDPYLETQAWNWIEQLLGETIGDRSSKLTEHLKTGVVLCKIINKIRPASIKIQLKKMPFFFIENLGAFLRECVNLGVESGAMFATTDLTEDRNPPQVIRAIIHLAKHIAKKEVGYTGPTITDDKNKSVSLYSLSFMAGNENQEQVNTPKHSELVEWVNGQFKGKGSDITIKNLNGDFRSGIKLIRLVEVLTAKPIGEPPHPIPTSLVDCTNNINLAFHGFSVHTFTEVANCTAMDFATGNLEPIKLFISLLRDTFDLTYVFVKLGGQAKPVNEEEESWDSEDEEGYVHSESSSEDEDGEVGENSEVDSNPPSQPPSEPSSPLILSDEVEIAPKESEFVSFPKAKRPLFVLEMNDTPPPHLPEIFESPPETPDKLAKTEEAQKLREAQRIEFKEAQKAEEARRIEEVRRKEAALIAIEEARMLIAEAEREEAQRLLEIEEARRAVELEILELEEAARADEEQRVAMEEEYRLRIEREEERAQEEARVRAEFNLRMKEEEERAQEHQKELIALQKMEKEAELERERKEKEAAEKKKRDEAFLNELFEEKKKIDEQNRLFEFAEEKRIHELEEAQSLFEIEQTRRENEAKAAALEKKREEEEKARKTAEEAEEARKEKEEREKQAQETADKARKDTEKAETKAKKIVEEKARGEKEEGDRREAEALASKKAQESEDKLREQEARAREAARKEDTKVPTELPSPKSPIIPPRGSSAVAAQQEKVAQEAAEKKAIEEMAAKEARDLAEKQARDLAEKETAEAEKRKEERILAENLYEKAQAEKARIEKEAAEKLEKEVETARREKEAAEKALAEKEEETRRQKQATEKALAEKEEERIRAEQEAERIRAQKEEIERKLERALAEREASQKELEAELALMKRESEERLARESQEKLARALSERAREPERQKEELEPKVKDHLQQEEELEELKKRVQLKYQGIQAQALQLLESKKLLEIQQNSIQEEARKLEEFRKIHNLATLPSSEQLRVHEEVKKLVESKKALGAKEAQIQEDARQLNESRKQLEQEQRQILLKSTELVKEKEEAKMKSGEVYETLKLEQQRIFAKMEALKREEQKKSTDRQLDAAEVEEARKKRSLFRKSDPRAATSEVKKVVPLDPVKDEHPDQDPLASPTKPVAPTNLQPVTVTPPLQTSSPRSEKVHSPPSSPTPTLTLNSPFYPPISEQDIMQDERLKALAEVETKRRETKEEARMKALAEAQRTKRAANEARAAGETRSRFQTARVSSGHSLTQSMPSSPTQASTQAPFSSDSPGEAKKMTDEQKAEAMKLAEAIALKSKRLEEARRKLAEFEAKKDSVKKSDTQEAMLDQAKKLLEQSTAPKTEDQTSSATLLSEPRQKWRPSSASRQDRPKSVGFTKDRLSTLLDQQQLQNVTQVVPLPLTRTKSVDQSVLSPRSRPKSTDAVSLEILELPTFHEDPRGAEKEKLGRGSFRLSANSNRKKKIDALRNSAELETPITTPPSAKSKKHSKGESELKAKDAIPLSSVREKLRKKATLSLFNSDELVPPSDELPTDSLQYIASLTNASWNGDLGSVKSLLGNSTLRHLVNVPNDRGQTALYCAARQGHSNIVLELLNIDTIHADVQVEEHGGTPLHAASFAKHSEIVALLLAKGASSAIINKTFCTPKQDARGASIDVYGIFEAGGTEALKQQFPIVGQLKETKVNQTQVQEAEHAMRQHIFSKLLKGEDVYICSLDSLLELFAPKVESIFPNSALNVLLLSLRPIVQQNKWFYTSMLSAAQQLKTDLRTSLALCFPSNLLSPYLHYLTLYLVVDTTLGNSEYNILKDERRQFEESSKFGWTLDALLKLPISRAAHYLSTILDLIKFTNKQHPDYVPLTKLSQKLQVSISEMKTTIESSGKCTDLLAMPTNTTKQNPWVIPDSPKTCKIEFKAGTSFDLSEYPPITKNNDGRMKLVSGINDFESESCRMEVIPDLYQLYFKDAKHFNFICQKKRPTAYFIVSVLQKVFEGEYFGLETSDHGWDIVMIQKDQLQKTPGRGLGTALLKYFQTKYPHTRIVQLKEDAIPAILNIEKKHKQIMPRVRIGLIYCLPNQVSPFDMFANKKVSSPSFLTFMKTVDCPTKFDPICWYSSAHMKSDDIRQYIGNTNVLIFFVDSTKPLDVSKLDQTGQMCHCFIVVHAFPDFRYRISVLHRQELSRPFGPNLPLNYLFPATTALKDFILTLVYNAQMSIVKTPPTNLMYKAPRQSTLKELAGQFASKLLEGSKK